MLDMCLVTHVFLQVNSCLISKMKGIRQVHVKEEERKKRIVRNRYAICRKIGRPHKTVDQRQHRKTAQKGRGIRRVLVTNLDKLDLTGMGELEVLDQASQRNV
jgi:hypothetical protein